MTTISSPTAGGGVPPSVSAPVTNSRGVNISSRIAAAKPPRITIQIPPHGASALPHPFVMSRNNGGVTTAGSTPMPPSVSTAGSPSAYANPFGSAYQATTAGFMFKQFEGLKDFTFASAKSGLNIGEKSAFYIYEKFSKWSRKWFTHCFLFLVILLYSVAGAFMFVALEGEYSGGDVREAPTRRRVHWCASVLILLCDLCVFTSACVIFGGVIKARDTFSRTPTQN